MKAIYLALLLTACGGGGSSAPAAVASTCKATMTVTLHGDSTFYGIVSVPKAGGGFTYPTAAQPPSALLQIEMDRIFGPGKVIVNAQAVFGGTGQQAIDGTNTYSVPLAKIPPSDVDVFNFMINDQANYPLAQYHTVLETFAAYGPDVVFMTSANRYIDPFQNEMRAVAKEHGIPVADLNAYFLALPTDNGYAYISSLLPDGTHGTQAWYAMVVKDVLAPVVSAEVSKSLCR